MLMYVASDLAEEWTACKEFSIQTVEENVPTTQRSELVSTYDSERDALQSTELEAKEYEKEMTKKGKQIPAVAHKHNEEHVVSFPFPNLDKIKTPLLEQLTVLHKCFKRYLCDGK